MSQTKQSQTCDDGIVSKEESGVDSFVILPGNNLKYVNFEFDTGDRCDYQSLLSKILDLKFSISRHHERTLCCELLHPTRAAIVGFVDLFGAKGDSEIYDDLILCDKASPLNWDKNASSPSNKTTSTVKRDLSLIRESNSLEVFLDKKSVSKQDHTLFTTTFENYGTCADVRNKTINNLAGQSSDDTGSQKKVRSFYTFQDDMDDRNTQTKIETCDIHRHRSREIPINQAHTTHDIMPVKKIGDGKSAIIIKNKTTPSNAAILSTDVPANCKECFHWTANKQRNDGNMAAMFFTRDNVEREAFAGSSSSIVWRDPIEDEDVDDTSKEDAKVKETHEGVQNAKTEIPAIQTLMRWKTVPLVLSDGVKHSTNTQMINQPLNTVNNEEKEIKSLKKSDLVFAKSEIVRQKDEEIEKEVNGDCENDDGDVEDYDYPAAATAADDNDNDDGDVEDYDYPARAATAATASDDNDNNDGDVEDYPATAAAAADDDDNDNDDGDDDQYDNNGHGVKEGQREMTRSLIFSNGEYRLALEHFSKCNSGSFRYLQRALGTSATSFVASIPHRDNECYDELLAFKRQLKQDRFPPDSHNCIRQVKILWGSNIVVEHFDKYYLLTAPEDIHCEIQTTFPTLFSTETETEMISFVSHRRKHCTNSDISEEPVVSGHNLKPEPQETLHKTDITDEHVTTASYTVTFKGHHSKLVVNVYNADITKVHVDVIVSATTSEMKNYGGVARAIHQAAGRDLMKECDKYISRNRRVEISEHFVSSGGTLLVKQVYHTVGPRWAKYISRPDDYKRDLRVTILKCLFHAEQQGHRSIAFPSIGAVFSCVPEGICAESYMKAVRHFENLRNLYHLTKLQEIHYVDIDSSMVDRIQRYFIMNWDKPIDVEDRVFEQDKRDMDEYFARIKNGINIEMPTRLISPSDQSAQDMSSSKESARLTAIMRESAPPTTREECVICMEHSNILKLSCCNNLICKECDENCEKCPFCRCKHRFLTGSMPPSRMTVLLEKYRRLPGVERMGCYEITYSIHDDFDNKMIHKAYIPFTTWGLDSLLLLTLAFYRQLTFIRNPLTILGWVSWSDIPHKTSLKTGDQSGYPDPGYLHRLNSKLSSYRVSHDNLREGGRSLLEVWRKELMTNGFLGISS